MKAIILEYITPEVLKKPEKKEENNEVNTYVD